jgi:type I restriction enzyme S subunit
LNELRDSSVGSTTKFLTLKLLENLPISLPPISEQREIAEILASINEKISTNNKLKEKLTLLKKGLMQDLLNGIIRTNI